MVGDRDAIWRLSASARKRDQFEVRIVGTVYRCERASNQLSHPPAICLEYCRITFTSSGGIPNDSRKS